MAVWPSAVGLLAAMLLSATVGAALGGGGDAALSGGVALGAVVLLSVAVWSSAKLLIVVGPLVLGGEIPEGGRGGVVSSDDKRDQLHVYLLEALEDVCQTT